MSDIKYLGVQGLEELIILTQNALAKKADVLQFDVMPDPIKYIGKVVQYVGASDVAFTRSHFYYSNGVKWTEENISGEQTPKIEMVTALPSWVDADPQALYILKNTADITMSFYVKNPSVNDAWFTVEKSISFVVVDTLPQWGDADSSTIYFKANGNDLIDYDLVGYIKNTSTIDAWYTFGEKPQITIDAAISATSTNPLQNKVIFSEVQGLRAQANTILTASQDADKKLQEGVAANSNALGSLGTEVSGIHDDIESIKRNLLEIESIKQNLLEIESIKQNLIDVYATQRYVENQNLLSDFEDITISDDKTAPTRMEYDGYVTFIDSEAHGVRFYINDTCVGSVDHSYTRYTAITVFVAKNDKLHCFYPSKSRITKARFYKLRDYTNRPYKE